MMMMMMMTRRTGSVRRESSPNVTLPTINLMQTALVWNPCLRNVQPELSVTPCVWLNSCRWVTRIRPIVKYPQPPGSHLLVMLLCDRFWHPTKTENSSFRCRLLLLLGKSILPQLHWWISVPTSGVVGYFGFRAVQPGSCPGRQHIRDAKTSLE